MGLLDNFGEFVKTPEGQGLLSAVFGGMATARRGAPINSLGAAGLAGVVGYNKAIENSTQDEFRKAQMSKILRDAEEAQRKQEALNKLRNTIAPEQQTVFDVAPDEYIKTLPTFQKPQLVEVADPNEPLRTVKKWMRPGESDGSVAGYGAMPEALDPRIQDAKLRVAAAGRSNTSVTYGAPVAGVDANGNPVFFQPSKDGGAPAILPGVKPTPPKPGEGPTKQLTGISALNGAIGEYLSELENWKKTDTLLPDSRARMGTKYNNMMLQAKEAYNLGVLNGPDFEILQSVITDPRSINGLMTSKKALSDQAKELSRMMGGTANSIRSGGNPTGAQQVLPTNNEPAKVRRYNPATGRIE